MRKTVLATLAVALASAAVPSAAGARTGVSVEPTGTTFTMATTTETGLGSDIDCTMTLAKTLHSRISKVLGALIGTTSITINTDRCTGGNMGLLVGGRRVTGAQGPYHLTYRSFSGTLPNITAITRRLNDITLWVSQEVFIQCLTSGAVDIDIVTTGGNPVTGGRAAAQALPVTGSFECPVVSVTFSGTGSQSPSVRMTLF